MGREISSAVEHAVHIGGVAGSNPASPTSHFSDSTTHRGDVAELLAAAELLRRGYRVSRPLSNGTPYDLIVDDSRRLFKIQVKKAVIRNGALRANLSSSKYHRGRARVLYKETCDAVIVVDCENVNFYVFHGADLNSMEVWLRTERAKNGQSVGIRPASDYELSRLFPATMLVDL